MAENPAPGILARPVEDLARWARGTRAALTGDPAGALHQFRQIRLPALALMAAQERIDAAVRADDRDQAGAWVRDLTRSPAAPPCRGRRPQRTSAGR